MLFLILNGGLEVVVHRNTPSPNLFALYLGIAQTDSSLDRFIIFCDELTKKKVFLFTTLLTNFVPLAVYVTVEMITVAMMSFLNSDLDMYHAETDTPALVRSTIVTDVGQVKYVFSDKTGTLTRNMMEFRRCSVDGVAFGSPVEKSAPPSRGEDEEDHDIAFSASYSFLPLWSLLSGGSEDEDEDRRNEIPTFNAEMFVRVMGICHTVVVEKEYEKNMRPESMVMDSKMRESKGGKGIKRYASKLSSELGLRKTKKKRGKKRDKKNSGSEPEEPDGRIDDGNDGNGNGAENPENDGTKKGPDGAPLGYVYQAESPDEGALVSAASKTFGFQVSARTSTGLRLSVDFPSVLSDQTVTDGLRDGTLSAQSLSKYRLSPSSSKEISPSSPSIEDWMVLAVNKFESDRKRMSVLVRSPPELGSVLMLFCKGADSSMLNKDVCVRRDIPLSDILVAHTSSTASEYGGTKGTELSMSEGRVTEEHSGLPERKDGGDSILGLEAHLGDFATEGLRTLVLGVRVLNETTCRDWLKVHADASNSIVDRDQKLSDAAKAIETDLHIVGATAIEDRLQEGVPDTIATLGAAGIKLWVLTGDKRETAIEIGYSTRVLTPKMSLLQVVEGPASMVRANVATEFVRLIKMGKLPKYSSSALNAIKGRGPLSRCWRTLSTSITCQRGGGEKDDLTPDSMDEPERRRGVRRLAVETIEEYSHSARQDHQGGGDRTENGLSLQESISSELPPVFQRASTARNLLVSQRELFSVSQNSMPPDPSADSGDGEDVLSRTTETPDESGDSEGIFDRKKRTLYEKAFAGTLLYALSRLQCSNCACTPSFGVVRAVIEPT